MVIHILEDFSFILKNQFMNESSTVSYTDDVAECWAYHALYRTFDDLKRCDSNLKDIYEQLADFYSEHLNSVYARRN